jgi:hypothetical protein
MRTEYVTTHLTSLAMKEGKNGGGTGRNYRIKKGTM